MLHLGITLIVLGAFALILPLLGRQFIIVTLLQQSGQSTLFIATALVVVGSMLCYRSSTKGDAREAQSSAADTAQKPRTGNYKWAVIGAVLLVALVAATRYESPRQQESPNPYSPTVQLPTREDSIAEQMTKDPHRTYRVSGGEMTFESAISPARDRLRLKVVFRANSRRSILEGSVVRSLILSKPLLCGEGGLIRTYQLEDVQVTLSTYEGATPVGEVPVPSTLCL